MLGQVNRTDEVSTSGRSAEAQQQSVQIYSSTRSNSSGQSKWSESQRKPDSQPKRNRKPPRNVQRRQVPSNARRVEDLASVSTPHASHKLFLNLGWWSLPLAHDVMHAAVGSPDYMSSGAGGERMTR